MMICLGPGGDSPFLANRILHRFILNARSQRIGELKEASKYK
jgi:hypothetical protein